MTTTLLISDLHLTEDRPDITAAFVDFLAHTAPGCTQLFILGDLFDAWLGDDDDRPLAAEIAQVLAELVQSGTQLFVMHGNRDFLLGADYCGRCGAELIEEPYSLATSFGPPVLLLHGDTLCTDDHDYIRLREMFRDPAWQAEFLAKPLGARREFAHEARAQSRAATKSKTEAIMDVNAGAVLRLLEQTGHQIMIHGHTHRPATHKLTLNDGSAAERIVLGDWDKNLWFVEISDAGIRLQDKPLSAS